MLSMLNQCTETKSRALFLLCLKFDIYFIGFAAAAAAHFIRFALRCVENCLF